MRVTAIAQILLLRRTRCHRIDFQSIPLAVVAVLRIAAVEVALVVFHQAQHHRVDPVSMAGVGAADRDGHNFQVVDGGLVRAPCRSLVCHTALLCHGIGNSLSEVKSMMSNVQNERIGE